MPKFCGNCYKHNECYYRGILNPCSDWRASAHIRRLRVKAGEMEGMPMSFDEHRFVDSCVTAETFSPKMESWLISIYNRVMYMRT